MKKCSKQFRCECLSCSSKIKLETPRLDSVAACDRPETIKTAKLPTIPEVVWQQPPKTSTDQNNLNNNNIDSTIQYTQETSMTTVASKTLPLKRFQLQNYEIATEQASGNQTGNEPVPSFNCSNKCPTDIHDSEQHAPTSPTEDTTIPTLTITTPLIEEGMVRDEQTNDVHLPITSTVVLRRKQETFSVPLHFGNNLTADVLVDSGAYVSASAQNDWDTTKQKAPHNILKIDDPRNFKIQVANVQLEKPLTKTTIKFEIRDNVFAEHFVVMKKLTGPILGLHFMRNNSVVIDTTHGLIHFPHLTMLVKIASIETTAKPQPVITDDVLTIPQRTTKKTQPLLTTRENETQQGL